ncbi:MAG TPA: hypothetical protein ENJ94_09560 [Gammaproteobacteria bacterium]|nr:hypothetical protein [Gammaproteobacteria bacterium]
MRPRHKRYLLLALILAAAMVLGLKGLMHLRVKLAVDNLITDLADRARIEYRDIDTRFDGSASVKGVVIEPHGLKEPITVEQVRIRTGDLGYFLDLDALFGKAQRRPDQLFLQAEGIRLPLDDAILAQLRPPGALQPADAACTPGAVSLQQFRAMGLKFLEADVVAGYRFDREHETLDLEMEVDLQDVERIEMALTLGDIVPEDIEARRLARVRLVQAELAVDLNPQFARRWVAYCAQRRQLSPEAFVEAQIAEAHRQQAAAGVTLGERLQQALDDYSRNWGELRLSIRPAEPLPMLRLATTEPERLVQTLGLRLTLNGQPVQPLELHIDPQRLAGEPPGEAGAELSPPPAPRGYRLERRFVPAGVGNLGDLLGRKVRIWPKGDPVREGVLIAVVDGDALVEQLMSGGKVVAYVPLKKIERIEVEEVKKIPRP